MPKKAAALPPVQQPPPRMRIALLLALIAFALYANTLGNGFVLDDVALITGNRIVSGGFSAIPQIFTTPYLHGFINNPNDLYRPLSLAMFAAEWSLSGGTPMLSHAINVIVFCGCVAILFLFLDELFRKRQTALAALAAFLFALHPVHTEVVANIKSRDELLAFAAAFGAFRLLLRYARGGKPLFLAAGAGAYFLSLLSKETGITFLVLTPLVLFLSEKESKKRILMAAGAMTCAAGIFLAIRLSVLNAFDANHPLRVGITENALAAAPSFAVRLATALLILGKYLGLLLLPYPLLSDYSFNSIPLVSFDNVPVWISVLCYAGILIAGIRRLAKNRHDIYGLSMLFLLVPLALFSNIAFLVGATMAERFLFFPSVGFCLAAAHLFKEWAGDTLPLFQNRKLLVRIALPALLLAGITVVRNQDWKDGPTLYRHDIGQAPNSYRLPYYLGSELINQSNEAGDSVARAALLEEAIGYLKKSIAVYPRYAVPYAQVGVSYMNLGRYDSAERYELQALALNDRDTFTRNNLAAAYFRTSRYREAIELCRSNLQIDPTYARSWSNIGVCYMKLGIPDSAIIALRHALALQPDNSNMYYYLSAAFGQAGLSDSAKKYAAMMRR